MKLWATIASALARHGRCAMVTLAEVAGSAPREAGARMIIMPDGTFRGTIGGGALEWRALAEAQVLLADDAPQASVRRQALGPELGQCCGGSVRLLFEVFDGSTADQVAELAAREARGSFATRGRTAGGALVRTVLDESQAVRRPVQYESNGTVIELFSVESRPLYLFGAGHVGRAVVLALAPLPFEITWVDERRDAFPAAMPGNVRPINALDPVAALADAPPGAFVLVLTHSHALDLELILAALAAGRFPYVGLIGSATKRARFAGRLRQAGVSSEGISALVCPIGIAGITSKAPAAIAAAVAADLLIRDEALRQQEPVAVLARRA